MAGASGAVCGASRMKLLRACCVRQFFAERGEKCCGAVSDRYYLIAAVSYVIVSGEV